MGGTRGQRIRAVPGILFPAALASASPGSLDAHAALAIHPRPRCAGTPQTYPGLMASRRGAAGSDDPRRTPPFQVRSRRVRSRRARRRSPSLPWTRAGHPVRRHGGPRACGVEPCGQFALSHAVPPGLGGARAHSTATGPGAGRDHVLPELTPRVQGLTRNRLGPRTMIQKCSGGNGLADPVRGRIHRGWFDLRRFGE